jgi:valyl-tRNA synthetase
MSKSLGNVLDPIEVSDKYGTDAVRMSLVVGATAGGDLAVGEAKIKGYRNFSNKLWNIARFVLSNLENSELRIQSGELKNIHHLKIAFSKQDLQDLKKLDEIVETVTKHLDNFQFSRAGELLYSYSWHEFADKIIEQSKDRLKADDKDSQAAAAKLLLIMSTILKMLHPFIPFVTETIWQNLPNELKGEKLLISAKWPGDNVKFKNQNAKS